MRKLLAGAVLSAAVIGGGAAVVIVNPLGIAGAQSTTTAPAAADPGTPPADHRPGQVLDDVLNDLVGKGTLSQDQANAVRDGVKAKKVDAAPGGPHGRGPGMREGLDAAASALGMTADELRTELQSGKSVAQVAQDRGVNLDDVKNAIVTEATGRIDQAVSAGKLTQEQADKAKAALGQRIDDLLNGTKPAGGPPMGRGHGGPHGDQAPTTTVPQGQN